MNVLHTAYHHTWQNFLMPDRLEEYRALLRAIAVRGYRFLTMEEFAAHVRADRRETDSVCVLRNDVDSDPGGAGRMFEIDRAEGARATYYFRLATIDRGVIERMRASGAEVGYHFEELASYAKQAGIRTKAGIEAHIPAIRDMFRGNVTRFTEAAGVAPRTVAAHGDFANRRLGVTNNHIVDRALLDEFGIVAETYEPWLMSAVTVRLADRAAPVWWHPMPPEKALRSTPAVLYILVHPRQWVRNPWGNSALDVRRGAEELAYRWRCMRRR